MNVLVTGGLGTVGLGLTAELRSRGYGVVTCDLAHQPDEVGLGQAGSYVRCDIAEFRQLERVMDLGPFDLVYNCAAEFGRWNGEDFYENLWRTNAIGMKHLLRLQETWGFRLVHFSSSEVYGDYPGLMTESVMDDVEVRQLNDYAMSKWVNEMQVRNSVAQHGTETVVVRLFNTYGPGEHYSPYRSVNCRFLHQALNHKPWTVHRGHQRTSTYLADAVRTIANIAENFHPGETYNIGGAELHTIEELSDLVLDITGADPSLVTYRDAEPMTTTVKRPDVSKSVRDLDHRNTVSLRAGMERTAEWMRDALRASAELPGHSHHPVDAGTG